MQAHKSQAVTLTATGALLYRYAERILAKSTDLVNAARDLRELRTGKLHIAASQTPGVYHAPRLIGVYSLQAQLSERQLWISMELSQMCVHVTEWPLEA